MKFTDDEEPGNAGSDNQNLEPTDLDDEQLSDLVKEAEAELNENPVTP